MIDIVIMVLSTLGALFILIASIGILKMPDFYSRLSVTIKAATLGLGCILIAAALFFKEFQVTTKAIAIIFFIFITSPIAGYLIGKVAYINGTKPWKNTFCICSCSVSFLSTLAFSFYLYKSNKND